MSDSSTSSTPSTRPAAGWYPDPAGSGGRRWWDGAQWTDHMAPAVVPPTPAPVVAPAVRSPRRRRPAWEWVVVGVAALVIVSLVVAVVALAVDRGDSSSATPASGNSSAQAGGSSQSGGSGQSSESEAAVRAAVKTFEAASCQSVTSLVTGQLAQLLKAQDDLCDSWYSTSDQGYSYKLGTVTVNGSTATAEVAETYPAGQSQAAQTLHRTLGFTLVDGKWLASSLREDDATSGGTGSGRTT